jgi:Fur family ferric uptake transcriptional regulator
MPLLTPEQKFNQFLSLKRQRLTRAREKIITKLFGEHTHMHLDELISWAKQNDISRATLFRTLSLAMEAGLIGRIFDDHNRAHYEHIYAHEHHRHLVCTQCGLILETRDPVPEDAIRELCREQGFTQHYNVFQVFGLCRDCSRATGRGAAGKR